MLLQGKGIHPLFPSNKEWIIEWGRQQDGEHGDYISQGPSRKELVHSNGRIWGEFNKGVMYKGLSRHQGNHTEWWWWGDGDITRIWRHNCVGRVLWKALRSFIIQGGSKKSKVILKRGTQGNKYPDLTTPDTCNSPSAKFSLNLEE